MNAKQSLQALKKRLKAAGATVQRLSVAHGFALMLQFCREERADDCPPEDDGDMVLFQWGTNDWGNGEFFDLNLTRQFISGDADDENIWQLSLTFKFVPDGKLKAIGSGNKWCEQPQAKKIDQFEKFIRESAAYLAVNVLTPAKVELTFFNAG